MFYKFGRAVVGIWLHLWYNITYVKNPHIADKKGFIIAGNHQSNLDPCLVAVGVKQTMHYMAKAELFENKILGFLLRKLGQFPVQRGKGDSSAIDFAVSVIESGDVLGIFPEGTRSLDGRLLRPKSGAALIAQRTKADILPVGITYENKGKFRSKITVKYGEVIPNHLLGFSEGEMQPRELRAASTIMMQKIGELVDYVFPQETEKHQSKEKPE